MFTAMPVTGDNSHFQVSPWWLCATLHSRNSNCLTCVSSFCWHFLPIDNASVQLLRVTICSFVAALIMLIALLSSSVQDQFCDIMGVATMERWERAHPHQRVMPPEPILGRGYGAPPQTSPPWRSGRNPGSTPGCTHPLKILATLMDISK